MNTLTVAAQNNVLFHYIFSLGDEVRDHGARVRLDQFLVNIEHTFCAMPAEGGRFYWEYQLVPTYHQSNRYRAVNTQWTHGYPAINLAQDFHTEIPAYVISGELVGMKGLMIALVNNDEVETYPLEDGFEILRERFADEGEFLPILHSDAQMISARAPYLKVYRVNPTTLASLPSMQRSQLVNTISRKIVHCVRSDEVAA